MGMDGLSEPDVTRVGRFALHQILKRGNGVDTYIGVDGADGAPVVVKTMVTSDLSTAVRLRLEHEADVLARFDAAIDQPLVASGYEGPLFYLVQRRLDGVTLRERLDAGPLPVTAALQVAADLLCTLEAAHDEGVLHRDLKPANVMVQGGEVVERAQLIDFGLARSTRLDVSVREELVGTAQYLAPEAAGLVELGVDERSDLYALGVVLFECLAGRPPFEGATVGEVLRHHLNTPAPSLRALGIAVPRAVDGVVQRLLGKDPDARYQSARAVRTDILEIQAALAAGVAEPPVTPGRHDHRHALTEPAFVGRTDEFAELTAHVERAARGSGCLVVVEAESGGGKTRLLDEVALHAARHDFWVLRGQGVDRAAQRPYQVLDGVVNGIASAGLDDESLHRLRSELGDWADAAAAALPGLARVVGSGDGATLGPEAFGETRSVDALTALFDSLGQRTRPVLIVLDDCQWADGLTISLLTRWQARRASRERCHVLVVAAYRSEEVVPGHPLRAVAPTATIALPPFEDDDVRALCASMAGPLPVEVEEPIVRLAEGSPFMAAAVLRGMVESGALRDAPEGWYVDPEPLRDAQTSRRAALFLARRFELLGPSALTLLTVGAVLGKEFDLGLAAALTGQPASEVTPALDDARRRRILWVDEAESRCSFTHDKLRETLLGQLEPGARTALHRRAAELIEAIDPSRVFELAYHFDAAGELARALPYALAVAEQARSQHALEVTIAHYRMAARAIALDPAPDPEQGARVATGLGDVLTLQGNYEEASALLGQALALATDPVERAELEGKLGDVAFKTGDQLLARRHLESALRSLGRRVPRTSVTWVLAALKEAFVQALHTLLPRVFVARRSLEGAEQEFLAIRIYSRLAYVYWFSAGKIACGWTHLREMNLAERYPPTSELAQAYSEHAPVMTMVPWFKRGMTYARRSYEIRRDLGDVWGQGQSLNFHGVVLYAASRYRECIEQCREAVRVLERTGDRWEQNTATWHLVFSHYRLGELDAAVDLARQLYASASAIGDRTAAGVVLSGWARAGAGLVPEEYVAAELERDNGDAQTASEVRLADGLRRMRAGDLDGAVARLTEATEITAAAGLRQEYVAPVKPWLATVLRLQLEATDVHVPRGARDRRLRRAARAARQAERHSRAYRNNRPHALRERGLMASLQGRTARARRLLERSLVIAERQEAAYEMALTRVALARLDVARGVAGAAAGLERADADRDAFEGGLASRGGGVFPERETLSLADRFESLLAVGRSVAAATSPWAVYDAVREAAALLLRGDRCHIIEVHGEFGDHLTTESGELVPELSQRVLALAVEARGPVVAAPGEDADSSESLLLSGLRSVLCAPILSDGEVVACLYVTHHEVNDLFGDAEVQLAEFIATLAGAALEHVAGSEARFRSLVQNSSDVITIVDVHGRVTYQSSSVERVFGYHPSEVVGRELRPWLHPVESAALRDYLEHPAVPGRDEDLVETRVRHRDGSFRDVETTITNMLEDPHVQGLVLNTRDVSERVVLESELRTRAWHDPLTGLANRALFADRVDHALARRARENRPLAVAFLDLDDFKSINDTLGHPAGDLLLQRMGERLQHCVRPGDTVARLGGDEFALLFEDADGPTAEKAAARIIREMERPFQILDEEVFARASIGLALGRGDESSSSLLSGADTAMYVAKTRGKSRYEVFQPEMRDVEVERAGLRSDLEWALQRGELHLHYQPVIDIPTGAVCGFEALLRWAHPRRGLLEPSEFIVLAEQTGLIVGIGAWVLRSACRQAEAWRAAWPTPFTIAVNVSARQLQDPGLVHELATALRESNLSPAALVLEITESATVADTEGIIARLEELKRLGVGLAIDDFGTGYSSLSYLRRFPVDQLKVDRSFVAGVASSAEDRAIVASVIDLAHALGISVVAEGVEQLDQLAVLSELGCDLAQGFNWPLPALADEVERWLATVSGGA